MKTDKTLIIRFAKKMDLEAILEIQFRAYTVHEDWLLPQQIPPLNETIDELTKSFDNIAIIVATKEDEIVGSVRYQIKSGVCFLERLSVDPKIQRQGIGKKLVLEVEHCATPTAHKVYLETALLAADLIQFYTDLDYSAEAILKNHYGNFDWITFSKRLVS